MQFSPNNSSPDTDRIQLAPLRGDSFGKTLSEASGLIGNTMGKNDSTSGLANAEFPAKTTVTSLDHTFQAPLVLAPSSPQLPLQPTQPPPVPQFASSFTAQTVSIDPKSSNQSADAELVSIVMGPNSTLKVNPNDAIDIFANTNFSLVIDGPNWQQHGPISYSGLTKSDPFIKFFRSYAITLFKSGELSKYLQHKYSKTKKRSSSTLNGNSKRSKNQDLVNNEGDTGVKLELGKEGTGFDERKANGGPEENEQEGDGDADTGEGEEEEIGGLEDSLVVNKIGLSKEAKARMEAEANIKVKLPDSYPGIKAFNKVKKTQDESFENIVFKSALQVLPSQRSIFILFYRFFKYVCPFIPIIDEHSLIIDLCKILPEKFPRFQTHKYNEIIIKHPNDMNTLAILLLIVRLGYMSMIHNDELNNEYTADEKTAADEMKPISSEEYSKVISLCIPDELTLSKSSFKLIQALTLQYFYRQVAPEDCHGLSGSDAQLLLGIIIRHSINVGLNRDPKKYTSPSIKNNEPLMECWRRLWHYLMLTDAITSIHCGTVLNVKSLEISDVVAPKYEGKTKELDEMYYNINMICDSYRNLSNKINNIQTKPKVVDILAETNELEKIFFNFFGKDFFKDYICLPLEEEDEDEDINVESPTSEGDIDTDGGLNSLNGVTTAAGTAGNTHNDPENKVPNVDSSASSTATLASSNFEQNRRNSSISTSASSKKSNKLEGKKSMHSSTLVNLDPRIKHEKSYIKVIKFITFIQLRTNLSSMYYMIAVHYENKYNESKTPSMSAGIELFKIYIKSVVQLIYIMSYVLEHLVTLFSKNYDYILTSSSERCMIKTHAFISSFFVRILHHKKDLTVKKEQAKQDSDKISELNMRLGVLHNLFLIVLVESECFVGSFKKLSRRYVNSYRIQVMLYLVLKQCMSNPDFFFDRAIQNLHHEGTNMLQFFTLNELEQVSRMCEEFRSAKEEQNKMKKERSGRRRRRSSSVTTNDASQTSSEDIRVQLATLYYGNTEQNLYRSSMEGAESISGVGFGAKGFKGAPGVRLSLVDDTANSNASTSSQSPLYSDPSIAYALNNSVLGDNPINLNEDYIKIFDVYNDIDHD